MDVRPLTPTVGAEIHGVDISKPLSDGVVAELRAALLDNLVIFFRDQSLSPAELVAFATRFGEISYYPFVKGMADQPEIVEVIKEKDETVNFGGLWHTDTSYLLEPPLGSILYALEVPPLGGDTLFANMYQAFDALSPGMKSMLEELRGINSAEKADAAATRTTRIAAKGKDAANVVTTASHPLVRTHPETGRKALYCSAAHTVAIEGLTPEESAPILAHLYQVQQRPEFSCRFQWARGSVAFWDNRAAQHNALNDYHGHRRVMHRVTLAGGVPS
ncbi:MAG: TauD/TfdA family dioxygenase [Pseudomonadota bacterium]